MCREIASRSPRLNVAATKLSMLNAERWKPARMSGSGFVAQYFK
jgi:hypothetical protein